MRLSSELRAHAIMRRAQSVGAPCYLITRGDVERGAIYVWVRVKGGRALLFGPPPPSFDAIPDDGELKPVISADPVVEADVEAYMRHQRDVDPDLWLIEIEHEDPSTFTLG